MLLLLQKLCASLIDLPTKLGSKAPDWPVLLPFPGRYISYVSLTEKLNVFIGSSVSLPKTILNAFFISSRLLS